MNKVLLSLLLIIFCHGLLSSCQQKKITFVYDNERILTKEQSNLFEKLFSDHEKKTTNEIVLVTTPNYHPDTSIESYSLRFLREHGIGKQKINNGLVIVFSQAYRRVRIETGYGTENVLKDGIAKKIIDSLMIPEFKNGKFYEGLLNGSKAIVKFLEKPENKIKE